MAVTYLEAKYVARDRLTALLRREFGDPSNYDVTTENDWVKVTAPRELTQVSMLSPKITGIVVR
ncbi:hypothetical protein CEP54_013663 [Fusarium duplospermum]|uniref:Uncharacterized protein n=1 Tax=Fusarium duplospermum TaxID=1325734 RepID=A0A428P1H3_9HYPO|nr:hypothetical protein CEP54_013663 [Fusarium duplospermum]